jgi:hypothetical protein
MRKGKRKSTQYYRKRYARKEPGGRAGRQDLQSAATLQVGFRGAILLVL